MSGMIIHPVLESVSDKRPAVRPSYKGLFRRICGSYFASMAVVQTSGRPQLGLDRGARPSRLCRRIAPQTRGEGPMRRRRRRGSPNLLWQWHHPVLLPSWASEVFDVGLFPFYRQSVPSHLTDSGFVVLSSVGAHHPAGLDVRRNVSRVDWK